MTRVVQPCGTQAAYQRHLHHREPACDACLAAERRRKNLARKPPADRTAALFRELLDLITAECRHAGLLPGEEAAS
jgi:hypothetical protein